MSQATDTESSSTEKTRLELPLLLPHVDGEGDQCVDRLIERLTARRGVESAHVTSEDGKSLLCIHYDPNQDSLRSIERIARREGAKVSSQFHHEQWQLAGMDCADCATSIEHIIGRKKGVIQCRVNYASERMLIEFDSKVISKKRLVQTLERLGYDVVEEKRRSWIEENSELFMSLMCGLFLALAYFGPYLGFPWQVQVVLYTIAYASGGYDATHHGLGALSRLRFDIDILMVIAAIGAAMLGELVEGGILLFLFSFGHAMEHYAMGRARRAIKALGEITPKTAVIRVDGRELTVKVEEVQKSDIVIVRNGERIPVDGVVHAGVSAVDQAAITGESMPVGKEPGDSVFAGTVNGDGALEIEVTKLAQDTTLARVIQMVEEAQTQKSSSQRFTETFERFYVPIVLIGVLGVWIIPPYLGWLGWGASFMKAMTVLVSASPCALAIATPAAILAGVGQAARNGILIKGGVHLENLGSLRAIGFDKTGTLTQGKPAVTEVITTADVDEREVLRVAAAVESRSSHPLAAAVIEKAKQSDVDYPESRDLKAMTGHGVEAFVDDQRVLIGNAKLFEREGTPVPPEVEQAVAQLSDAGRTIVIIQRSGTFLGVIGLADQPRPEARSMLERLKMVGVKSLIMITGDNKRAAAAIAQSVGVTDFRAELLPEDKVTAIKELLGEYKLVGMVGDGVNDAPAMKTATVGIAMGAGGSDVALETADVALMADDLSKLPLAVALSRKARMVIFENVLFSLGVIILLVIATFTNLIGITIAIVVHEGSTLLVVANALTLLRFRRSG
ncbi:putative cadmium-transporting ATPase [Planctomycetes bacterium Pan216]|uniref:P-type Zn(2+) transporter n=1 Tax=Kolteria novifilia TaxID=2527975 RepID=A0A518B660_9BACT|nr:putative cadmium-transporting ATPase [Planctomycetes bacterium Pan216]